MSSKETKPGEADKASVNETSDEFYCPVCDFSFHEHDGQFCPKDGTKLVRIGDQADPLLGRILDDRFTIKAKIGSGGMGSVYRAVQHSVGREVAIKIIEPRLANNRDITKRFLREAQLSSRLSQPNTVSVLDFGQTDDGLLYLVMELLQGRSLEEVLRQDGALAEERVIRIGIQMCDALDAAQSLHIVHRDLKPANTVILDQPPGRDMVKVLDFGIAKSLAGETGSTAMTRTDVIMGTPSYIAPEAIEGRKVDARTDLYSLGIMLYECVTGRLPFDATTVTSMLTSHINEPPRALPDTVSPGLRSIIQRLISKSPADRFQSAADVRAVLAASELSKSNNPEAMAATAAISDSLPSQSGDTNSMAHAATMATPAGTVNPHSQSRGALKAATASGEQGPAVPESTTGRAKLWFGAGAVLAISVVAAIGFGRGSSSEATEPTVAGNRNAVAAPPSIRAEPPAPVVQDAEPLLANLPDATAAQAHVSFGLDSRPRGARVTLRYMDGSGDVVICAQTPCTNFKRPREAQFADIIFELSGYRRHVEKELDLLKAHSLSPRLTRLRFKHEGARSGKGKGTDNAAKPPADEGFLAPN